MRTLTQTILFRTAILFATLLPSAASQLQAQVATDACSFAAGSQYTVGTTCTNQAFNKPNGFVNNMNPTGCSGSANDDGFGWFIATGSSTTITYTPDNSGHDPIMHLFSGTCASLTNLACANAGGAGASETITYATTIGTSYLIRIQRNASDNGMNGQICIWSPVPNDDPCGATTLTLGAACTMTTYNSTGATATAGIPAPGCSTYSGADVWFKFVAPASGAVTIRTGAGSITNLAMALYSATACNGTFTLMECDDNDGPANMPFLTFSSVDLVVGNTYYLRVWESGGTSGGTFTLCANTDGGGGSCLYSLRMYDLGGDGWGGSTVTIQVGAAAPVNYTITTGNQEVAYIAVTTGDLVQISYTAAGGFQNEISYFVQVGAGILYQDGPTPGTGPRYAGFATCTLLGPPPSDCSGGASICNSQSFNDSPSHTGVKADLTVDNRGCLSSDERQGTWYNFTPSASGTIELTISPTNASDDYDFAIWGPLVSLACPPVGAPYRCSYSALTGNTGLQIGSGDDTEGAGGNKFVNGLTVVTGEVYVLYISNFSRSGLAFTLTWNLTSGASLDCFLLPVEFTAFDGHAREKDVVLNWETGSEMNSAHYIVERSNDGVQYTPIGMVEAQGSSSSVTAYEYVDAQPIAGINYYRLIQVDLDGTTKNSQVEAVVFRHGATTGYPYPNPANDLINLDLQVGHDQDVDITIHDASGRLVRSESKHLSAGDHHYQASLMGLEAGSYQLMVGLADGTVLHSGRFMVQ